MAAMSRADEITHNLADVLARIDRAREAAGRDDPVTLIAVTKTHPVSDVRILRDLGVVHFGENRDQEAAPKAAAYRAEDGRDAHWHFIGQMQSNKARSVVRYASFVHTVDRASLVDALERAAAAPIDCLLQLSVDGDPTRGGVPVSGLLDLAERIGGNLRLRGIMAVAPLGMDPAEAFAHVAHAHDLLRSRHPDAALRCIGMSDDLEAAIAHGATHVRVGSAILGARTVI